jgi:hypothetical protein
VSFLDRIRECNAHDLANFLPFFVDDVRVGWVRKALADRLAGFGDTFEVQSDSVSMARTLATPAARTAAMALAVERLAAEGLVKGMRGELYPVSTGFAANPSRLSPASSTRSSPAASRWVSDSPRTWSRNAARRPRSPPRWRRRRFRSAP